MASSSAKPRNLIAVDLTNVREMRPDFIDFWLRALGKEPFTPGFALRFMEYLESLNLGVPIFYFHDYTDGALRLNKPKKLPQDVFDAECDEFLSYFNVAPDHPRHIWTMGAHQRKADYALAHLHNNFNAVLISRDNFREEIRDGLFQRVTEVVQYELQFNIDLNQLALTENRVNRRGHEIINYFPYPSQNPSAIIDAVAKSIYPLLDDRVKVIAPRERLAPTRGTKIPTRVAVTPAPATTRQPALLSLLAMTNWSIHIDKRVKVMGRLFVADPHGYPSLRWVGSDRNIEIRISAERIETSIREGDFVHVLGTLVAFGDSRWGLDEIGSIEKVDSNVVLNFNQPSPTTRWSFSKWGVPPWRRSTHSSESVTDKPLSQFAIEEETIEQIPPTSTSQPPPISPRPTPEQPAEAPPRPIPSSRPLDEGATPPRKSMPAFPVAPANTRTGDARAEEVTRESSNVAQSMEQKDNSEAVPIVNADYFDGRRRIGYRTLIAIGSTFVAVVYLLSRIL
jgi:hypothetical protein